MPSDSEHGERSDSLSLRKAMKTRSAARGWVTRACKFMCAVAEKEDTCIIELQDAIEEFDKRD